ncbi:M14 family metallopeptidase [Lentibacillus sp. Marseille-P4043]|uniref:M14 family metallopeptidase n=1 Tax=Lentibacillus sp. Marseille-P4043 TaxID=2040293 RepID=UPI000D0AE41F|nr:M14 family metallopeptidase [Lentibacillus sp. Marseille-P4043]
MKVTIRNKDSFWYFSQLFDIPLVLIETSNPGLDPTNLHVGQRVNIPGYILSNYTIKNGDTLWKIAINRKIPMDALFLVNPFVNQYSLLVGQQIFIPERLQDYIVQDVNHYTYEKMCQDLEQLIDVYPFIVRQTIGHSVMGKDLVELQLGIGDKQVHVDGSFHANEWITTPVIMRFLNQYVLSLTNNVSIRGIYMLPMYIDTSFSLVPMVNPDGVNLVLNGSDAAGSYKQFVLNLNNQQDDFSNWKANIKGVDLNNQYPALWNIEADRKPTTPQPRDYPGPHPLSEPESITMAELARTRNFTRLNAFHTQGKEFYWGFEGSEPPISAIIAEEYARVSGYTAVRYLDSYAGYKDWFIQEFKNPGFTIELGSGMNPLSIKKFPEIYQESLGIMLANLYL